MELNSIVFPAPKPSYTYLSAKDHLFYIKNIPCLFVPCSSERKSKVLVYYHGNAEDIGVSLAFTSQLAFLLGVHVIVPEYPGYGIYQGAPTAQTISSEALQIYDFIKDDIGIPEKEIIVFGRSLGSGPATYVTAHRNPSMLILMSAFTSLKAVVKNVACIVSCLVKERFRNVDLISTIKCPKIFIHGLDDRLVPSACSEALFHASSEPKQICLREGMDHNFFDPEMDITEPISKFWDDIGFNSEGGVSADVFKELIANGCSKAHVKQ